VARTLAAAIVVSLLVVSGAGGSAAQTPRAGGTLDVAALVEPPCLNLFVNPCAGRILPVYGVVEGAFKVGPDWSWRPRLVSAVDVTTKPPFTLTYHVRREARWNDGTPVSARDFVFTYRARLRYTDAPDYEQYETWVRSVRALDAKTVRVVLRSRFAFWRGLFAVVLPEHALRGENLEEIWSDRIDNPKTGRPIGNGPFLVERWERGEQLTLVRNPRYWGSHRAYLDRIVLRYTNDAAENARLFRNGEADIGQWQFDPDFASELRRVPGLKLLFAPNPPGWEHLDIRMGVGGHRALRSKLVRRALAYGIDRVAIARALFGDEIDPRVAPLDNLLLRRSSRSYAPNWSVYRYRPAEARRLLERAGCRRGADGIYSCAGERLSLRFVARGAGRRAQTLELVQAHLKQAGVEVVPIYATQSAHDQFLETGNFDVTLFAWFGAAADAWGIKGLYGCGGAQNYLGYCQRLVTRDLDQADRIVDAGRRARVLNGADVRLARDVPSIPLFEVPALAAVKSSVRNFLPKFSFVDPTWNAENWWLER
jgi:peptide/nickel transport system substrate-binding protein